MTVKEAIGYYIDNKKDEMISVLRTIVQIPSVQGEPLQGMPFGEEPVKALTAMLQLCKAMGLHPRNVDNYVGTVDFHPTTPPELGILCHLDVVPEGSGWSVPPYDITVKDGKLIGRGAIDDKGPCIAALYAMRAIKELKIPLQKGVRLILGTNEENGSCDLAYYRMKEELPPLLFTPDGSYPVINCEKGMLRIGLASKIMPVKLTDNSQDNVIIHSISGGNTINAVPEYAECSVSGLSADEIMNAAAAIDTDVTFEVYNKYKIVQIIAKGKSAHASTPEQGHNAITALIALLSKITRNYPKISALSTLYPCGETDGKSLGFANPVDFTAVLSVISFDGNMLDTKSDIRFPNGIYADNVIDTLIDTATENGLKLSVLFSTEPHYVPEDSEFIQTLLSVYEDFTGEKGQCVSIGGGTYVHGIPNGVAFGAEFPNDQNNIHGADEFITIDSLLLNTKIYAEAILRICG